MSYISAYFAVFVLITVCVYYWIPPKIKYGRECVLLLASLLFYASCDVRYLGFLLFTSLTSYFCALALPKVRKRKLLLAGFLVLNAGLWYAVKALPWTVQFVRNALTGGSEWSAWSLLVPLGISYYTLQAIAYVVDVYRGKVGPERSPVCFLLFLSYFPAIVQGPISRYDELMPELRNRRPFSVDLAGKGLFLVLVGLVKKLVIADRLGIFVDACYASYSELSGMILYLGAVAYAVQLYCDFSGCVDLCRGVSFLFNIKLINNFNRPYLATSVKDFWGRWHISLTRWLRDYIYIPLGGNRKGTLRKYLNIFIVFLVSGLWHGAGLSFFVWGALHGFYQVFAQCTAGLRVKGKKLLGIEEGSLSDRICQTVITFNLITFAWIFFRAGTLQEALGYVGAMFTNSYPAMMFNGTLFTFGIGRLCSEVLVLNIVLLFVIELRSRSQDSFVDGVLGQHLFVRWGFCLLLVFDLLLFGVYGSGFDMSGFLYGGF